MAFEKIIILDDEMIIRRSLEEHLRRRRYYVASVSTIAKAKALLAQDNFDLIFVDVKLPDGDGTELLAHLAPMPNRPLVVIITGFGTIESAVKCMRDGAFEYLMKPFSIDLIDVVVKKAEAYSQLLKVNRYLSTEQQKEHEILGRSSQIVHLKKMIRKVSTTEATVLITGESGTGKELVARELFRLSPRSDQPYIRVNCAAMPESLIESEFFGHEKGSFTGASHRREGRFELANNGTILLDEISEISPRIQSKLLRVLQEQEFERVGGNKTIKVNVRILTTTNRNLLKAVEHGEFREDLYYRLNVFPIIMPTLRDRRVDIMLLAERFLERYARKHGIQTSGFSKEVVSLLQEYDWPGNVRELENTIERAVILTENGTDVKGSVLGIYSNLNSLPEQEAAAREQVTRIVEKTDEFQFHRGITFPLNEGKANTGDGNNIKSLDEMEKDHILFTLRLTQGNRKQAAEILNISTRTLRNKLNQYRSEGTVVP